jgi:hypothetical protein
MDNTARMIHVGTEIVLIGGIFFYFNNQIKSVKNEVKELKIKIEENQEAYNKHLNNLYSLIDKLNSSVNNRQIYHPGQTQPFVQKSNSHPSPITGLRRRKINPHVLFEEQSDDSKIDEINNIDNARRFISKDNKQADKRSQKIEPNIYVVESDNEEKLDKELDEELQELQNEDLEEDNENVQYQKKI